MIQVLVRQFKIGPKVRQFKIPNQYHYFKNTNYSNDGEPKPNVSEVAKNNHNFSYNKCITVW